MESARSFEARGDCFVIVGRKCLICSATAAASSFPKTNVVSGKGRAFAGVSASGKSRELCAKGRFPAVTDPEAASYVQPDRELVGAAIPVSSKKFGPKKTAKLNQSTERFFKNKLLLNVNQE